MALFDDLPERPADTRGDGRTPFYERGARWPAWAVLAIPFALFMAFLEPVVRRKVRWMAAWCTVFTFELLMYPAEHQAIRWKLWVYNNHRLLGIWKWGVPIEEPLIYYCLPPVMVIMVFELATGLLDGTIRPDWERWVRRLARV